MQLLKKISARTVLGSKEYIKSLCPEDGTTAVVMRIGGVVTGTDSAESNFGVWTSLLGSFKAFNSITGEEFRGRVAFVPDEFLNEVVGPLETSESVEFVLDIGVKTSSASIGYEYVAIPKTASTGVDPLASLFGSVEPLKTLAAPSKDDATKAKAKAKPKARVKTKVA